MNKPKFKPGDIIAGGEDMPGLVYYHLITGVTEACYQYRLIQRGFDPYQFDREIIEKLYEKVA